MPRPRIRANRAFPSWFTAPWELIVADGQSRGNNQSEGTDQCYAPTESPLIPQRCLMLNNNGAPGRTFEADFTGPEATDVVPFVDGRGVLGSSTQALCPLGQSLGSQMYWLDQDDAASGRPSKTRLFLAAGEGGRKISELKKGAVAFAGANGTYVIWDRKMRQITRAKQIAGVYGRQMLVRFVDILQGEADAAANVQTPKAAFKADRLQFQADMQTDIAAITGQSQPVDFFMDITASTATGAGNVGVGSDVILAQVELARENADGHTWCVGPSYWLPYMINPPQTTAAHMPHDGVVRLAEVFARAKSILLDGGTPDFLYATGFTLAGNQITIDCHAPSAPLVIDTSTIPAATGTSATGNVLVLGFELTDAAGAAITGVFASGSQIVLSLSGTPTGAPRLRYAMNGLGNVRYADPVTGRDAKTDPGPPVTTGGISTPGAWGNIRDSLAVPSRLVPGAYIRNFLAPFDKTF